jgi:hypothetical protein
MPGLRRLVAPRWLVALVVPALAIVAVLVVAHPGSPAPAATATPTDRLAPPIGGITCDQVDHRNAPVAVHLTILIHGKARDILANVGTYNALVAYPSSGPVVTRADCYYWLHTGQADGVVHADPPAPRAFTLGDFFDVWHQPLGTNAVTSAEGAVTSYVNGLRYTGNPRTIPLTQHAAIQLDVGQDVAPIPYTFPNGD